LLIQTIENHDLTQRRQDAKQNKKQLLTYLRLADNLQGQPATTGKNKRLPTQPFSQMNQAMHCLIDLKKTLKHV